MYMLLALSIGISALTMLSRALIVGQGEILPPAIRLRLRLYTCQTDLWQFGQLVLTHAIPSVGRAAYAHQLMSGQVALAPSAEWND